jgi:hypothetical protein
MRCCASSWASLLSSHLKPRRPFIHDPQAGLRRATKKAYSNFKAIPLPGLSQPCPVGIRPKERLRRWAKAIGRADRLLPQARRKKHGHRSAKRVRKLPTAEHHGTGDMATCVCLSQTLAASRLISICPLHHEQKLNKRVSTLFVPRCNVIPSQH